MGAACGCIKANEKTVNSKGIQGYKNGIAIGGSGPQPEHP